MADEFPPGLDDGPVDRAAVRLLHERLGLSPPFPKDPAFPDLLALWGRMARTYCRMSHADLTTAMKTLQAPADGPDAESYARAHALLLNVWIFKAEGDEPPSEAATEA